MTYDQVKNGVKFRSIGPNTIEYEIADCVISQSRRNGEYKTVTLKYVGCGRTLNFPHIFYKTVFCDNSFVVVTRAIRNL